MSPSIWQILIVVAIIILLFGPSRIPGLGKSLGEAIRGFKKGISDDEIDVTDMAKNESSQKEQLNNSEASDREDPTKTSTESKEKAKS